MLTYSRRDGGDLQNGFWVKKSSNIHKGRMYVMNEKLDLWPLAVGYSNMIKNPDQTLLKAFPELHSYKDFPRSNSKRLSTVYLEVPNAVRKAK